MRSEHINQLKQMAFCLALKFLLPVLGHCDSQTHQSPRRHKVRWLFLLYTEDPQVGPLLSSLIATHLTELHNSGVLIVLANAK